MTTSRRSHSLPALLAAALATGMAGPALAQQSEAPPAQEGEAAPAQEGEAAPAEAPSLAPHFSGFVDVTYNYNFAKPNTGQNFLHFYDFEEDTFRLNNAHLAVGATTPSVSYNVEVDIGSDAQANTGDDDFDIQEAWFAYVSPSKLGFKAGKLITPAGIEVFESGSNPTISRGYLFSLALPVFHTGVMLTYQFTPEFDGALGVVNGLNVARDNNRGKTFIAKVGYTGEGRVLTLTGTAGPEKDNSSEDWRYFIDATGMLKVGAIDVWAEFYYGGEAAVLPDGGDATWLGGGLQPIWHVSDAFAVGARGEVFNDSDGFITGFEQTLFNITVAPAYTITPGMVLRAELRADISDTEVFPDDTGDLSKNQVIAMAEGIYSF